MGKKQLSKSEISDMNQKIKDSFGVEDFFSKKDRVVVDDTEKVTLVLKDDFPVFFYFEGEIVPTLKSLLNNQFLKQVVVDMGAVKFMASGADVMRPGIVEIDGSINKGDFVVIVDETHKKPLCIGKALFSGSEMKEMDSGKVLKNVHYVGDSIWGQ